MSKLRVWLELSRGANLPTVWSNVFIGWLIAVAFGGTMDGSTLAQLTTLLVAVTLLYTGGMFLNDACDAEWDAVHRPERPIPSGRIARRTVWVTACFALVLGAALVLSVSSSVPATAVLGLLLIAIFVYSRWHKANPFAPVLMGLCRATLPIIGYLAFTPRCYCCLQDGNRLVLAHATALFLYTVSISLLARHEATGSQPHAADTWMATLAPIVTLLGWPLGKINFWAYGVAALLGLSIPLYQKLIKDVGVRVAERIASLILLDYVAWRLIAPGFAESDGLAKGGMLLLLLYGTALGLRRLMPTT